MGKTINWQSKTRYSTLSLLSVNSNNASLANSSASHLLGRSLRNSRTNLLARNILDRDQEETCILKIRRQAMRSKATDKREQWLEKDWRLPIGFLVPRRRLSKLRKDHQNSCQTLEVPSQAIEGQLLSNEMERRTWIVLKVHPAKQKSMSTLRAGMLRVRRTKQFSWN